MSHTDDDVQALAAYLEPAIKGTNAKAGAMRMAKGAFEVLEVMGWAKREDVLEEVRDFAMLQPLDLMSAKEIQGALLNLVKGRV